uniref:RING-box protein 2 isoform X1 n=1 Tax=Drosophila rhopaloa TaxID=1041015 RepID=A0A6P4E513_DRORH
MVDDPENSVDRTTDDGDANKPEKMFTLKKWNAVAMWSWDVECDICAICRVQVMGKSVDSDSNAAASCEKIAQMAHTLVAQSGGPLNCSTSALWSH